MALEGQTFTPENTLEKEHLVIDTKERLHQFYEFLFSQEEEIDALNPDLIVDDLPLPEAVAADLKKLRFEYRDLIRFIKDGLSLSEEELPEPLVDNIVDQYQSYLDADANFFTAYKSYLAELEDEGSPEDSTQLGGYEDSEPLAEESDATTPKVLSDEVEVEQPEVELRDALEAKPVANESIVHLQQSIESQYKNDIRRTYDSVAGQFLVDARSTQVQNILNKLDQMRNEALIIVHSANDAAEDTYMTEADIESKLQRYVLSIEKIVDKMDRYVEQKATEGIIFSEPNNKFLESETSKTKEDTRDVISEPLVLTDSQRIDLNAVEYEKKPEIESTVDYSAAESKVTSPKTKAILAKSQLLLEKAHVMSGPFETGEGVAQSMVLALEELVERQAVGEDISDQRIEKAYQNLEQFVVENESRYLQVCGMSLPQAGPDGVFSARSFRDGLELVKRTHPELTDSPEKQTIVDKIIRTLYVVPAAGLTEEQVARVTELAKELDVTSDVVTARQNRNAAENSVAQPEEVVLPKEEEDIPESVMSVDLPKEGEKGWDMRNRPNDADLHSYFRKSRNESLKFWKNSGKQLEVEMESRGDGEIKITVAQETGDVSGETTNSAVDAIDALTRTPAGSGVVAEMEKKDTINNSIPNKEVRDSIKQEASKKNTLTNKYLIKNPEYRAFFTETGTSPAAFERSLQTTIKSIDAKEIDFWEAKFDAPYNSAFALLQDMTLSDIEKLNTASIAERRTILAEENVKNDAYFAWMDTYETMSKTMNLAPSMKFGELFAQWMLETEMTYFEGGTRSSQFTL